MAILRELISRLVIDDKKATDTLGKHDKQLKKTKRSMLELNAGIELMQKAFGAVRAVVRAASKAFDFLISDVAKVGDTFAKEAKKIGTTATSLQELSFAAERAGADQTKLVKAVSRMAKNLNDARTKNIGPFRDALDQLQIPIEEFDNLSPDETFARLADVIAQIEDPLVKAAVAQDIFGRSGRDLIPLLDEGSEGIEALRMRARELGLSMSDEAAASSEEFVDAMTDLKASVQGARFEVGAKLIPTVTEWVNKTTDLVVANKTMIGLRIKEFFTDLVDVAKSLAGFIKLLADNWRTLLALLAGAKLVGALRGASTLLTSLGVSATGAAGAMRGLSLASGALGVALVAGAVILDQTEKAIERMRAQTRDLIADVERAKRKMGQILGGESLAELRARRQETVANLRAQGFSEGQIEDFLRTSGLGAALEAKQRDVEQRRAKQIGGREERVAGGFERQRATQQALRGLKGKRRASVLERAQRLAKERGGGVGALTAAISEVRKGPAGTRRGGGGARRAAPKAAEPGAATDAELLALIEQAAPGTDLSGMAAGRGVPKATAPVVTVTVNQTNVDVDVDSPITIEGVAGMDAEQLASLVVERQGNVLDDAVREAIEAITPAAVGK